MATIKRLVTSPKGTLLADVGGGIFVAQANTMELAICKPVPEGYKVVKTVVGGIMMRAHKDFVKCVEWLKPEDITI